MVASKSRVERNHMTANESPACLITDTFGITPALARMYPASGHAVSVWKRILEIDPRHPLVTASREATSGAGRGDTRP